MKVWLTTTFLFFCVSLSYTQNTRTEIIGKILHFDLPISDAHIFNLNTRKGASSNLEGNFELKIRLNDTIHISHLEYTNKEIVITEDIINQRSLLVYLDIMTNYLNLVEISNHSILNHTLNMHIKLNIERKCELYINYNYSDSLTSIFFDYNQILIK